MCDGVGESWKRGMGEAGEGNSQFISKIIIIIMGCYPEADQCTIANYVIVSNSILFFLHR